MLDVSRWALPTFFFKLWAQKQENKRRCEAVQNNDMLKHMKAHHKTTSIQRTRARRLLMPCGDLLTDVTQNEPSNAFFFFPCSVIIDTCDPKLATATL
jgi:hypothetical protein